MRRTVQLISLMLLCMTMTGNERVPSPTLKLRLKSEVPVPAYPSAPIIFPARCNREGEVYLRFYRQQGTLSTPVVKISTDGQVTATYSLDTLPEYKDSEASDFALGPHGELFLLVATPRPEKNTAIDILSFDQSGTYKNKFTLDLKLRLSPDEVLPLMDGNFFVTGRSLTPGEGAASEPANDTVAPFTAIVDSNGRILKDLTLQNDVKPIKNSKPAPKGEAESGKPAQAQAPLSEISLGKVVLGDDGNIYLMRRTPNPLVFVLTAGGQFVRTLEVNRPSETAAAMDMKWGSGGKLVFLFAEPRNAGQATQYRVFSVVNSETGETEINYEPGPDLGAALACYTPNEFTFVGSTKDGHLAIKRAVAE